MDSLQILMIEDFIEQHSKQMEKYFILYICKVKFIETI